MTITYEEWLKEFSPADREKIKRGSRKLRAEMLLIELRKFTGKSQRELATALGIKQPSLSKLEKQDDMHLTTLKNLVEALGGKLEILVQFPEQTVRLRQFDKSSKRKTTVRPRATRAL